MQIYIFVPNYIYYFYILILFVLISSILSQI
jgi:hypothetical protein